MSERESGVPDSSDTLQRAVEDYLRSKGKGTDRSSGTYRRNAEPQLERFINYLADQDMQRLDELDATTLRRYVRDELLGRDLAPSTVNKYYDYVSAFIGWAQREGLVTEHYGKQQTAREPLPEDDTKGQRRQQTWHESDRRQFLRYVDERARAGIAADGMDAYAPTRDRALAYLFSFSGLRGAEVLATSDDDRRNGADWRDLGDEFESLQVLGKSQDWETRSIPPQARPALERWASVYQPEPNWPVIPTFHRPSLYAALPGDTQAFENLADIFEAFRDRDARPPSLSTDGARRLFEQLTQKANIDVEEGYLQLHGARRGVGRVLAMEHGADDAARQLGNSVKVVEESYSEVLASEQAEKTGEAFESHDG